MIGLGYIGLPTAAVFASRGIDVVGVDVNAKVVEIVNGGNIHIVEPELDEVVRSAVACGKLRATVLPEPADAFLIAVPTPFKGDNHDPDLRFIETAARAIAPVLAKGNVVVLESTSPVGATEQMARWIAEVRTDLTFPHTQGEDADIRVAHCPERVLPGRVMVELIENDRIIGGMTPRCSEVATDLYRLFVKGECIMTDAATAEMAKLTENSFRDVNIAFANELSIICERLGIDVWELIKLSNRHPRVNILQPGPGVGGHCIAVDPWFIVARSPEEARLIRTARDVNDAKPDWILSRVAEAIACWLRDNPASTHADLTIACYGIAFKPDIDDLRESPALDIVRRLARDNAAQIVVVEPNIEVLPEKMGANVALARDVDEVRDAQIHVMLVSHTPFLGMSRPKGYCVDARGVWRASEIRSSRPGEGPL